EAIREADGFEEGYAQGIELGKAEGYEEGEAAGFEKGEASGIVRGELKVAGAMKARGMTIDEICEITGLKRSQVEEL
ncbi:MAG: hypothetical protein ACI4KL_06525, partial [Lentihominibacter sp.]